jgi:hypothetical protein
MKVWPFVAALRREATNHRLLHWLKTVVVSETEKAHEMRQVGIGETLRKTRKRERCRNVERVKDDIKTGVLSPIPG